MVKSQLCEKRQKVRMCLCGAVLRGDGRSTRVPDRCNASKLASLSVCGVKILRPKSGGSQKWRRNCAHNFHYEAQNAIRGHKTAARAVHVMQNRAVS